MKWPPPDNTGADVIAGRVNKRRKLKNKKLNENKTTTRI
jgi:hypothetical protein